MVHINGLIIGLLHSIEKGELPQRVKDNNPYGDWINDVIWTKYSENDIKNGHISFDGKNEIHLQTLIS